MIEHLEGRRNLAETMELVRQHTRQLAKRQCTWFRSLSECRFVAVSEPFDAGEVAGANRVQSGTAVTLTRAGYSVRSAISLPAQLLAGRLMLSAAIALPGTSAELNAARWPVAGLLRRPFWW